MLSTALVCSFAASLIAVDPARPYTRRTVRFIVPFPCVGTADVVGRITRFPLTQALANPSSSTMSGADGVIAAEITIKRRPTDYTIFMGTNSRFRCTVVPKKPPYDPKHAPRSLAREAGFFPTTSVRDGTQRR